MRRLDEYISAGGKLLRCGYTTGTCAAAATRAAAELLLGNRYLSSVVVETPAGIDVLVDVEESHRGSNEAWCAVRKDAGDDPDATDGALVRSRVWLKDDPGIEIEGGEGVGRVTRAGLDQPPGAAAINSTPRAMIAAAAEAACGAYSFDGGLVVEISIPEGARLAQQTFNPRLGVEGGLSVLGTTGIVRPMSEDALIASIRLELNVLRQAGVSDVLVVPGNYGRAFATGELGLSEAHLLMCSNYLGATIDEAGLLGFESLLVVGHLGKMVKVAAGVMHLHSRMADCRMETLAAHAACAGASKDTVAAIMDAPTTDAVLELLGAEGLQEATMLSLMQRMEQRLTYRATENLQVEAIVFSQVHGILGKTSGAEELCHRHMRDGRDT